MDNSLKQYLDLYAEQGKTLCDNSPEALNTLRHDALEALEKFGSFPRQGDEGYEKISPEKMFAPDYGVNVAGLRFPIDVQASFRCDVPAVSTLLAVIDNDMFLPSTTLASARTEGVEVMSLAEAARTDSELVEKYLGHISANGTAATALNTLLCHDGILIRISAGTDAVRPIQIINILNSSVEMLAVRRILIVVEAGAKARVLSCDHSQNPAVQCLNSCVTEVYIEDGASLDLYDVEESGPMTDRYYELYAHVGRNGRLSTNFMSLSGRTCRNTYNVRLEGEGAETELDGMVIGNGGRTVDNASYVRHHAPHATSNQLFKYALFDDSHGAFEGSIYVDQGAHHTSAYQSNRNLLASAGARMHTKPQLEIYCDDVKCSHGATTGQLDAAALFYMRQRGIPEAEARMMLIQAFMADVIDMITIDGLRQRMHRLVERRLQGATDVCGECIKKDEC